GLGLIALQSVLGLIGQATDYHYRFIQIIGTVAFLGSAYLLLMFRDSFVPVTRWWRIGAVVALIGVGVSAVAVPLPYSSHPVYTGGQTFVLRALVVVWSLVVLEPTIPFWVAARGRPRVQRLRLRSLSLSF